MCQFAGRGNAAPQDRGITWHFQGRFSSCHEDMCTRSVSYWYLGLCIVDSHLCWCKFWYLDGASSRQWLDFKPSCPSHFSCTVYSSTHLSVRVLLCMVHGAYGKHYEITARSLRLVLFAHPSKSAITFSPKGSRPRPPEMVGLLPPCFCFPVQIQ